MARNRKTALDMEPTKPQAGTLPLPTFDLENYASNYEGELLTVMDEMDRSFALIICV